MSRISSPRNILSLLVQGSVSGLVLALTINTIRTYTGAPDSSPLPDQCNELTTFSQSQQFDSLLDFYPYYLCEHTLPMTKLFHFLGTFNALLIFITIANRKVVDVSSLKLFIVALVQVTNYLLITTH